MRARKRGRRACAFGTIAAPVPMYTCEDLGAVRPDGRATGGRACKAESARRSLACPSYAKCDVAIGRRVFAVSDRVVAKVFGDDEGGLKAETRAYGVLREIQASNGEFKALDARLVMPTSPRFDAAHLLVDRYTPWSAYAAGTAAGPRPKPTAAWGLVRQLQIMHEAGVAHGGVSAESVGVVPPPWSLWGALWGTDAPSFVLGCPRKLAVTPMSSIWEPPNRHMTPSESLVLSRLDRLVGGDFGATVVVHGPIEALLRVDDYDAASAAYARSAIEAHNEVAESMRLDRARVRELFGGMLGSADPGREHPLWAFLDAERRQKVLGEPSGEAGGAAANRAANNAAREAREAREAKVAELAKAAELAKRCRLCGTYIAAGKQGYVYEHRERADKVVKVYLDRESAAAEARAFRVLNRISDVTKEFRSLRAEPIPGADGAVVIDRFEATLAAYVNKAEAGQGSPGGLPGLTGPLGPTGPPGLPASAHLVGVWHFNDLLRQFAILHGHGVSHGDAHSGNTGLVVTAAGPRFVIGDPTALTISPLSWLSNVAADGDAGRVLGILRAHAAGKLSGPMIELDSDDALSALLRAGGVDPDKTNARIARSFLEQHHLVVDEARYDLVRLMNTMGHVPGIKKAPRESKT